MESTNANASPPARNRQPQTGAPRRFGVGTLLVITAMYSMLFALLKSIDAPAAVFWVIAGYVTAVGLGQVFLFGGKLPREASILVGAGLMFGVCAVGAVSVLVEGENYAHLPMLFSTVTLPILGAVQGYLVGCVIGGVFLVGDRINRRMRRSTEQFDQP